MKKLMFLFVSFFCFAHSQVDSVRIVQKLNQLDKVNSETKALLNKADHIAKENQSLIYRIKAYIDKLSRKHAEAPGQALTNNAAVRPDNINEPVTEIDVPDGVDSIRGSFFYRLFHRNIYILKPYKIVNDEKVYLD